MKEFNLETNEKINSGFKIPDNYFDQLSEKVLQKISEEPAVISIYRKTAHGFMQLQQYWLSHLASQFIIF